MKYFVKNLLTEFHFFHFDPLMRDLVLVMITGILVAISFVSVCVMIFSQS